MSATIVMPLDFFPEIAVWSNQGKNVAFAVNNEGKIYKYQGEEGQDVCRDNTRMTVKYEPGCHANRLILKDLAKSDNGSGKVGIFIVKQEKKWVSLGEILCAEDNLEDGTMLLTIKKNKQILASNKRDALDVINYTKIIGKGTGNLMHGVCRIVQK